MGDCDRQEKAHKIWELCFIGMVWRMVGTRKYLGEDAIVLFKPYFPFFALTQAKMGHRFHLTQVPRPSINDTQMGTTVPREQYDFSTTSKCPKACTWNHSQPVVASTLWRQTDSARHKVGMKLKKNRWRGPCLQIYGLILINIMWKSNLLNLLHWLWRQREAVPWIRHVTGSDPACHHHQNPPLHHLEWHNCSRSKSPSTSWSW